MEQPTNKQLFSPTISDEERWVTTAISCARAINKLFTKHTCRLCQVYSDKQLEFEQTITRMEDDDSNTILPTDRAFFQTAVDDIGPAQVEVYRQFLFDEDSVVEQVVQREGGNDTGSAPKQWTTHTADII